MKSNLTFGSLPDISFVGGGTFEVEFLMRDTDGVPFDADGCTAEFAATHRHGEEILKGEAELTQGEDGSHSVIRISLTPEQTRLMKGEYVYQISMSDQGGVKCEPAQGRMRVAPYINAEAYNG